MKVTNVYTLTNKGGRGTFVTHGEVLEIVRRRLREGWTSKAIREAFPFLPGQSIAAVKAHLTMKSQENR
jgi:hypothetical protein